MKNKEIGKPSRRDICKGIGVALSGLFFGALKFPGQFIGHSYAQNTKSSRVAVTQTIDYDAKILKNKVQHLFESIGGISDVAKSGDTVALKINITGGSYFATHPRLNGVDIRESMWTHPEMLRAVGELLIDSGIKAKDIYIVEALWDPSSYNNFGYMDIQKKLGVQLVDLNSPEPYDDFIDKEVGKNCFYYKTFKFNRILDEVNAFISIPKMKEHFMAGVTHSMKNLYGLVPIKYYKMNPNEKYRSALHQAGGPPEIHIPRTICDLNMARPIDLAVIDGIKNSVGGEGVWHETFKPAEYHLLLAGKDPVAVDSICSLQMGNNPESEKLVRPNGKLCDNHLLLAKTKGLGTNVLKEIELTGDGAKLISSMA